MKNAVIAVIVIKKEDMNFVFLWQEQYLTRSFAALTSKIKFI